MLRDYHNELAKILECFDPQNNFYRDESILSDEKKVIFKRSVKYPVNFIKLSKSSITIRFWVPAATTIYCLSCGNYGKKEVLKTLHAGKSYIRGARYNRNNRE